MSIEQSFPWAKLKRDDAGHVVGWHSLVDHSADVATVLEALLRVPAIAARLARLIGGPLDQGSISKLGALAFLHDIGKANRGFQSRWETGVRGAGHIGELAWLFRGTGCEALRDKACQALRSHLWEPWFTDRSWPLFDAVFAHHGRPWNIDSGSHHSRLWAPDRLYDPVATLEIMGDHLLKWFPDAFEPGQTLPEAPAFHHAFAGLLMLADWLGSDTVFFPFSNGSTVDRMSFARPQAEEALRKVGFMVETLRSGARHGRDDFLTIFGFTPRKLQENVRKPGARCVVLEAETGSGKTEAALWRFLHLFEAGEVDGMYFALPTRVAATHVFGRMLRFADAAFGPERPAIVLAVPGQVQADGVPGHNLPDFDFAWDDDPSDAVRQSRWAASHPKRFLAAQIAVGTVDQALLGTIRTRHAHMRGAMLLRQLLVVDEVHASDRYMETLLCGLLRGHLRAGGHALLLSATLGGAMRARLLGTAIPDPSAALSMPYPALFWNENGAQGCLPIDIAGNITKSVAVSAQGVQDQPDAIAALALAAARTGAKVLVIRNTVGGAIAVQRALELLDTPASHLFRAENVPAPHHSRYAAEDRVLLDHAVEACLGKNRPEGGIVIVGTQTLEVSLDLDADLLITDLCPADVLLQRIGRLHRHGARARPCGFETPLAIVLTPENRDLLAMARRGRHGLGRVYEDLRIIEATWRLIETQPLWDIPRMNRMLVEHATHPDFLTAIEAEFLARDPAWQKKLAAVEGEERSEVQQASLALLDQDQPFDKLKFDSDERVSTRLGGADRLVMFEPINGPFGGVVTQLRIPHHMLAPGTIDVDPRDIETTQTGFSFSLGGRLYDYTRYGLSILD
jgi:CRISPR-associated endonuclease/helicase Cas3